MINFNDLKNRGKLFLIAGPCVIESKEIVFGIATYLKKLCEKLDIHLIFKASYSKANRSSINSYKGPGIDEGLKILKAVKDELNLPILTDIHTAYEAKKAAEVADIIQIPAFLCRQTELLLSAGKTDKIVNVKKGQFLSPAEMKNVIDKVKSTGNDKIMLTERGTFFGYNNLVVDFRGFMEMKTMDCPVIFDATHSLQRPGALGGSSGGQPEYVKQMAMAAVATSAVDGLFIETHPNPDKALSDAKAMLPLDELEDLLVSVKKIKNLK